MYVYFNNQGVLTTSIPHGEPVRQGNWINLYACLPINFYSSKGEDKSNWLAIISTFYSNGTLGATDVLSTTTSENLIQVFRKNNDSEATYDLKDNHPYITYYFRLSPDQITKFSGKVQAKIVLAKDSENIINLGVINIFVEKILGDQEEKNNVFGDIINKIQDIYAICASKEDKANKITSWSDIPSNEKYPAESLVKNYVDINDNEYNLSPQQAYDRLKNYSTIADGNNSYSPQAAYNNLRNLIDTTEEIWYEPTTEPDVQRYKTWVSDTEINIQASPLVSIMSVREQPLGDISIDENQPNEASQNLIEQEEEQPVGNIVIDENQPV